MKFKINDKVKYLNRRCKVVYIHKNLGVCGCYYTYDLNYKIDGIGIGFRTNHIKEELITREVL